MNNVVLIGKMYKLVPGKKAFYIDIEKDGTYAVNVNTDMYKLILDVEQGTPVAVKGKLSIDKTGMLEIECQKLVFID